MQMLGERMTSAASSDNFETPKQSANNASSDDFDDDIPF